MQSVLYNTELSALHVVEVIAGFQLKYNFSYEACLIWLKHTRLSLYCDGELGFEIVRSTWSLHCFIVIIDRIGLANVDLLIILGL